MPLPSGCNFQNPFAATMAPAPVVAAAPPLAPNQGDHVFGDVLGVIKTALEGIFGGGQLWQTRMRNYSEMMETLWIDLRNLDFGHGPQPPLVHRQGAHEPDQHAHMFGGYSARLQWELAEIVCSGFNPGEDRRIGGYSKIWKSRVLGHFDDLMENLVDSTAMGFYIATPNQIRPANPATVAHAPLSLTDAMATATPLNGPGRAVVMAVLTRCMTLRGSFEGLLDRFDQRTKRWDVNANRWT
jgi:hypothetical protein